MKYYKIQHMDQYIYKTFKNLTKWAALVLSCCHFVILDLYTNKSCILLI